MALILNSLCFLDWLSDGDTFSLKEMFPNLVICNDTKGSPQYAWLGATLGAVDRRATPWVVLGGHHQMYSSGFFTVWTSRYGVTCTVRRLSPPVAYGIPQPGVVNATGVKRWTFTKATTSRHSASICSGVQKMCASSWVKWRTRIKPCSAPEGS